MPAWFRKYLLPGLIFQSLVIAGGYGTGREIVEFFLVYGPRGGLMAMLLVSMTIWSIVSAVSFELARTFKAYDYRAFFSILLGRWWWTFEVCYLALLAIIGAVIGAAAGAILEQTFGLPYAVGVLGIMAAIGYLTFRGSVTIERALTAWSAVLYVVYVVLFVWAFVRFGPDIRNALVTVPVLEGWFVGGLRYAGYNVVVAVAILFSLRHISTRREAVVSGLLVGPVAMLPGLLFLLAVSGSYPAILNESVPANYLLELLGSRAFQIVFQIMLFGTLIESGTGLLHSVNERIAALAREKGGELPAATRPVIAIGFLVGSTLLARVGLVDLIARGYGTLTWAFLLLFVLPVMTVGIWKIRVGNW